jgi:hypothetical protein
MNATKGYYSLVQYCPDLARQEAANVGIVLFCPERGFIKARMASANHRVRRFFGEEADGYRHLNAMKESLAGRLEVEAGDFRSLDDLTRFVETRANKIQLSRPKPVKVFDPERDLAALYEELVVEPARLVSPKADLPLRERLDAVLGEARMQPYLRRNLQVEVPALKRPLEVPYGFQNGRLNLIQPVPFTQKFNAQITRAACVHAVEGRSIFKHPHPQFGEMQLLVVADFETTAADARSTVADIFAESDVRLLTPDQLPSLAQEITAHGRLVPA